MEEADLIDDEAFELLVANDAEAAAIEDERVQHVSHHDVPAAQWSRVYMRLLLEQREASCADAWRAASNAETYAQALERLAALRGALQAAVTEATLQPAASPAWAEVVHSPDLFSFVLGGMTTAMLGTIEAVCRTWRQRVAHNHEWKRRLELLPRGYHDAPTKLRAWGVWERGAQPLSTIAQGVGAKGAVLALSALAVPAPARPLLEASDVAFAVCISVETLANPGTQGGGPHHPSRRAPPDAVPVDRSDAATYQTTVVCAQMLTFDRAAPLSGDDANIFVHWAGGQGLGGDEPAHAGLQWAITVGVAELLQLAPNAAQPADAASLVAALPHVYQGEYDYDTKPKRGFKGRGHGATRGASVSISVRAVRRSDKYVVTLLDKAPLNLSYGRSEYPYENEGLFFELQHLLPQAMCLDDEFAIGPYFGSDFPLRDLCVQACVWPEMDADGQGLAQWRFGLEFFLQSPEENTLKHLDTIAATPADMLRLLSHANWQRRE